jgi:hypothetical protein
MDSIFILTLKFTIMKKSFIVLAVIALLGFMTSCAPSTDKLIDQYEAALKAADLEEAREVATELEKVKDTFTEEQMERVTELAFGHAMLEMAGDLKDKGL